MKNNFDLRKFITEGRLFKENIDGYTFNDNDKAYGVLFVDNDDEEEIENTPYMWNDDAYIALVKSMGYTDPKTVQGELTHYFSPGDKDEMRIFRKQEGNPKLQPEDLTIGMYKKSIEKEFPDKESYSGSDEDSREKPNPKLAKLIEKYKDFLIDKFGLDKSEVEVQDYTYYDYVGISNPFGGSKAVHFYTLEDWEKNKKNDPSLEKAKNIKLDGTKLKYYIV
jgi:hypothetical protein